jgi:hypothetical protein
MSPTVVPSPSMSTYGASDQEATWNLHLAVCEYLMEAAYGGPGHRVLNKRDNVG